MHSRTAWRDFHAGKISISDLFDAAGFLAASLRAARSIGAYDTLLAWSREMKDLAAQEAVWAPKAPAASGPFAQNVQQVYEENRRFNKMARGLDMLGDVYASLAACAQGHCVGPDRSLDKLSPLLADWPAHERFDLLPDAVVELYARLGDGDKTLLALNNLLWLHESTQRQTLPPTAAAARLDRKAEVGALSDAEGKELDDLRTANAPSPAAAARAYPPSLPSVLSRLPDNITILAYYSGPGGLWLCRRRGKSPTKVFPLQTRNEDLTAAAERFRRSLADQTADWESLSSDLYKILLPASGGPIPHGDLVVVVGGGALGAFPFEALGPSAGRLLAVTNPVVYLSTLDSGVQPQWRSAGPALLVGYNGTLAKAEEEAARERPNSASTCNAGSATSDDSSVETKVRGRRHLGNGALGESVKRLTDFSGTIPPGRRTVRASSSRPRTS